MSDFQCRKIVKARKPHKCEERCERGIETGASYTRFSGVYDGIIYAVKVCLSCTADWDKAMTDYPDVFQDGDGVAWGELAHFLKEMA